MDCIFCKIIAGQIPCLKIYEDAHTFVFMDIARDVDGHMLAIPKQHVAGILDCDAQTLSHLMCTVQRVSRHCTKAAGYSGVNLLNASGESAGQSVAHFHIHLIPRRADDGVDAWPAFTGARKSIEDCWNELKLP